MLLFFTAGLKKYTTGCTPVSQQVYLQVPPPRESILVQLNTLVQMYSVPFNAL